MSTALQYLALITVLLGAFAAPQLVCARKWGRVGLDAATLSLSMAMLVLCAAMVVTLFRPSYTNPGGGLGLAALVVALFCSVAIGLGRLAAQRLERKIYPAAAIGGN